jgi:hypothetical protein
VSPMSHKAQRNLKHALRVTAVFATMALATLMLIGPALIH